MENKKYMIVRFFRKEGMPSKIKQKGLTLKQAQAHCSDPRTKKDGVWFDGYTLQDSQR